MYRVAFCVFNYKKYGVKMNTVMPTDPYVDTVMRYFSTVEANRGVLPVSTAAEPTKHISPNVQTAMRICAV